MPTSTTTSTPNATSSIDQPSSNAARQHLPSGSRCSADAAHQRHASANRRNVRVSLTAPSGRSPFRVGGTELESSACVALKKPVEVSCTEREICECQCSVE